MTDRETCPACGRYKPTRRERAGETSPLYTIVNRDGSVGLCWGEPGREFLCPAALPPADPALRTAGLAVAEREAEILRLIGERDEARRYARDARAVAEENCRAAVEHWLPGDEKIGAAVDLHDLMDDLCCAVAEARRELAAVVKAVFGPRKVSESLWAAWDARHVRRLYRAKEEADAAVAEAVRRVTAAEEGGGR